MRWALLDWIVSFPPLDPIVRRTHFFDSRAGRAFFRIVRQARLYWIVRQPQQRLLGIVRQARLFCIVR